MVCLDGLLRSRYLKIASIIFAGLFASCNKDEIVDPPPPKDPRTYSWTIDTLEFPGSFQTLMRDVWGSSATNVFAVGHNDRAGKGVMYHYDGQSWQPVLLNANEGGQIAGAFVLYAIHGLSANDIWAAGASRYANFNPPPNIFDTTFVIHFDGSAWREVELARNKRGFQFISGKTSQSVWFGGGDGTCYRWDGARIQRVAVPITFSSEYEWRVSPVQIDADLYCYVDALALATGASRNYMFAQTPLGSAWVLRDSFQIEGSTFDPKWGTKMAFGPGGELYSVGYSAFRWNGQSWNTFYESDYPATGISITGTGRAYVTTADRVRVLENSWHTYPQVLDDNWALYDVWANDTDVFVVAQDGRKTILLHGK